MAITALTVLRHGKKDGEVLEILPGDDVKASDVDDETMLMWVENQSVLVTGKDKEALPGGVQAVVPEPPPITSAADPRYLEQVREQRENEKKAQAERLAAFKKGGHPVDPQTNVDDGLPKGGAKAKSADGTTAETESDAEKAADAAAKAAEAAKK
jgi:hypothetical protein